jgi:NTE family protein
MTVGAVNACSGEMRYFDTRNEPLGVDHVMASGALPPAFAAIRIDGQPYWDGGIYSNTPIEAVLDDNPRRDSLIFAVNVWHQAGPEPASIREVMGRQKDIQFASRADSHILRQKQIHRLRHVIRELHKQIPASKQADAKVKELASWGCGTIAHVAHLVAPRLDGEDHTKDIDFTPAGVRARRQAGYADTMRMIDNAPWEQAAADPIEGVIEHR